MARTGIVLLHGKWDRPDGALAPLAEALRRAGLEVVQPCCTWAPCRLYDRSFADALAEAAGEIGRLRAHGCERVILGGHSLGANAALACAADGAAVDALLMLAPGHFPDRLFASGETREALARARSAPCGQRIRLPDFSQGRRRLLRVESSIWLSFFDPEGRAVMQRSARELATACAVMWVVSRQDAAPASGPGHAFDLLPVHPQNAFVEFDCSHAETPHASITDVLGWIGGLGWKTWTS